MHGPQTELARDHNVVFLKVKRRLKDTTALRDNPAKVAADKNGQGPRRRCAHADGASPASSGAGAGLNEL
jgi:hypothetical protein